MPENNIRACIETAARKLRQGPQVREGLIVSKTVSFKYESKTRNCAIVKVQNNRVPKYRPQFNNWELTFQVEVDDELVDENQLKQWLEIAGRRIGMGDWRPEKSGQYGRFDVVKFKKI